MDIRNGHITGRKIGRCGDHLGLEVLSQIVPNSHNRNKIIHMRNGKIIRSSSLLLKNDIGENIGALCINTDITDTLRCEEYLRSFNGYNTQTPSNELSAIDVNQLMDNLLMQCENMFDKSKGQLNKNQKLEIIKFLDNKGAFLITKSGDRVCEFLNISKFTLYNYLEMTRQGINHK